MRYRDDRDGQKRTSSSGHNGLAVIGAALFLGLATLSAYIVSNNHTTIKPASGTAQAMALASSNSSSPD